jgi:hypothetical protein
LGDCLTVRELGSRLEEIGGVAAGAEDDGEGHAFEGAFADVVGIAKVVVMAPGMQTIVSERSKPASGERLRANENQPL